MKAKVIIAQATAETAEALYGLVKKMRSEERRGRERVLRLV